MFALVDLPDFRVYEPSARLRTEQIRAFIMEEVRMRQGALDATVSRGTKSLTSGPLPHTPTDYGYMLSFLYPAHNGNEAWHGTGNRIIQGHKVLRVLVQFKGPMILFGPDQRAQEFGVLQLPELKKAIRSAIEERMRILGL